MHVAEQAMMEAYARLAPRIRDFFIHQRGRADGVDDLMITAAEKVRSACLQYRRGFPLDAWVLTIAARLAPKRRNGPIDRPDPAVICEAQLAEQSNSRGCGGCKEDHHYLPAW